MSDKRKITVAIMCYGLCVPEYRTTAEMAGLTAYLYGCIDYISALNAKNILSGVVLCGGFTNSAHPDLSEAATTKNYLGVLSWGYGIPISTLNVCLEEQSHNTAQNIVFTGYLMGHRDPFTGEEMDDAVKSDINKARAMMESKKKWHELSHNIVFVCDRYRHAKVWVMLRHAKSLLPNDFRLRVISFPRKDIHPNSSYSRQIQAALKYWFCPALFFKDLKVGEK